MITQKTIAYGAWTVLTSAGQDCSCWLDEDNDGASGSVDVRIVHSDSGEPALSEATKGKRVYKPAGNNDTMDLPPDNANDIYYATCLHEDSAAELSIDVKGDGVVNSGNSSAAPLAGGGVFTGESVVIAKEEIIFVSVFSDVASATDGLSIQQSSDGINWDHTDNYTVPANTGKNYSINPHSKYLRVIYTNGSGVQSIFRLQTIFKGNSLPSSHKIQDPITEDDDAELVKSVLTGQNPNNVFINFAATRTGNFKVSVEEYGDTPSIDAFGRLRVSEPYTIFDSKQLHDKQPLFWDESTGGAATSTHNSTNACSEMVVTASASDFVIRQTKQRFNYQPGKSQLSFLTFHAPHVSGITVRMGLFDGTGANFLTPKNGIFFESNTVLSVNIAKNGVVTESITQDNWNVDKLDGTGVSGKTIDLSTAQILAIDYEWLGVGRVRIGFVIDGLIYYCHYFNHANESSFDSVYMSTPNLPLRYSIETDGTNPGQLDHICSSVMSEGGIEETGILRSVDTGTTHLDANAANSTYAVIGIKLKSTYNDITVKPEYFSMIAETNTGFRWSLLLNPTVGGTFTYSDVTNSAIQRAAGVTANVISSENFVIDSGYVPEGAVQSGSSVSRRIVTTLRLGETIAGVRDSIVLAVTPLAANADIQASLTVRELL